jgi:integrase
MKQKWRNRTLVRGVVIDKCRGYVYVRITRNGRVCKELIGRTTDADVIDRANMRAQYLRSTRHTDDATVFRKQRMLVDDAADLFLRLHGLRPGPAKNRQQFVRYTRLMKATWRGRYVDTMTGDDMRRYRVWRREHGVADSTINREQTAIITLFNKLVEWRRSGEVPRNVLLPEVNPGKGVKKVNEDRFIRNRLLSDREYQALWSAADDRLRRILLAVMNLPLRLADLKALRKSSIDHKLQQFTGVQSKTNRSYALPINAEMRELVRTAPGDTILDFTGFQKRWKQALERAGLQPKGQRPLVQFRDLRRTAATALHDGGVALRTISAMLGHQSVTMTMRYLGLRDENLKSAGDVLAARYPSLPARSGVGTEGVPRSVPTIVREEVSGTYDSMREVDISCGCSSMVERQPSKPIEHATEDDWA